MEFIDSIAFLLSFPLANVTATCRYCPFARKRLIRHLVIFSPLFVVYLFLLSHFYCEKSLFYPRATYPFDKPEWVTEFRSLTLTAQI